MRRVGPWQQAAWPARRGNQIGHCNRTQTSCSGGTARRRLRRRKGELRPSMMRSAHARFSRELHHGTMLRDASKSHPHHEGPRGLRCYMLAHAWTGSGVSNVRWRMQGFALMLKCGAALSALTLQRANAATIAPMTGGHQHPCLVASMRPGSDYGEQARSRGRNGNNVRIAWHAWARQVATVRARPQEPVVH